MPWIYARLLFWTVFVRWSFPYLPARGERAFILAKKTENRQLPLQHLQRFFFASLSLKISLYCKSLLDCITLLIQFSVWQLACDQGIYCLIINRFTMLGNVRPESQHLPNVPSSNPSTLNNVILLKPMWFETILICSVWFNEALWLLECAMSPLPVWLWPHFLGSWIWWSKNSCGLNGASDIFEVEWYPHLT